MTQRTLSFFKVDTQLDLNVPGREEMIKDLVEWDCVDHKGRRSGVRAYTAELKDMSLDDLAVLHERKEKIHNASFEQLLDMFG
jgi:hypothetical protein